jgi:hypothetical protein
VLLNVTMIVGIAFRSDESLVAAHGAATGSESTSA